MPEPASVPLELEDGRDVKALVSRIVEEIPPAFNAHDEARIGEWLDDGHAWVRPGQAELLGKQAALRRLRVYWHIVPDLTLEVVSYKANDATSATVKWRATGVPNAKVSPDWPQHRSVTIKGSFLITFEDGRISRTKVEYVTPSLTEQLAIAEQSALDPSVERGDKGENSTLQDQESSVSSVAASDEATMVLDPPTDPNRRLLEVATVDIKTKEDLWRDLQDMAGKPAEDRTEDDTAYYESALQLLAKAITNPNGYTKEAKEALEYFVDLIGITPKLITLAQAAEYVPRTSLNYWIRTGVLKVRRRQKSAGRGGGTILVAEMDVLRLERERPGTGRPWSEKRKKQQ